MTLYLFVFQTVQIPTDLLFVGHSKDLTVRLKKAGLAVVPLSERPGLALLNEQLSEEVVPDGTFEVRQEGRPAAEQDQFRHIRANGALVADVPIRMFRDASADLLDTRQL